MPIYEYRCETCGAQFEELVGSDDAAPPCPGCGAESVERLFSGFGTKWRPSIVNWHRMGKWGPKPPKKVF